MKVCKDLIKFGDDCVHSYKILIDPTNLDKKIEDFVSIIQELFYTY